MDINFGIWSLIPPILAVALAFLTKNVILSLFVSLFSGCLILAYGNPWTALQTTFSDYLFVDMPPGTGDVPLTVFQTLPVDGVIIVASPQELVSMVVQKAVKMAQMMNIPIVGLVENMSYITCPDCGKKLYPFGEGKTQQAADEYGLPLLARMPIDPELAQLVDQGRIEDFQGSWLDAVADKLLSLIHISEPTRP